MSRILVYGGNGALGRAVISLFKQKNWLVTSVDFSANTEASHNIVLTSQASLEVLGKDVIAQVGANLSNNKLDAIVNVAGGWAGGNASNDDLFKNVDLMLDQSVRSSIVTARLAACYLKEGGSLTLTGAAAAVQGTPSMIAYGLAKAGVHHLVSSLSQSESGLPAHATVHGILPVMLDTPMNRKFMPDADTSTWTPLSTIAEQLFEWVTSTPEKRPPNGKLLKIVTKNSQTTFE